VPQQISFVFFGLGLWLELDGPAGAANHQASELKLLLWAHLLISLMFFGMFVRHERPWRRSSRRGVLGSCFHNHEYMTARFSIMPDKLQRIHPATRGNSRIMEWRFWIAGTFCWAKFLRAGRAGTKRYALAAC